MGSRVRNRHIVIVCLAGLALAGCSELVGLFESDATVVAPYELGKRYFAETNYAQAVEQFRLVVSVDPGSVAALNGLAASYDQMGRFDLAERYYKRALSIAPDSAQTLNNLGVSYLLQDRPDVAAVYLTEARARDDTDPGIAANQAAAVAALEARPVARPADQEVVDAEKPIRRMTVAMQRLSTQTPADVMVTVPQPRPVSEHKVVAAASLSIELSMFEPGETPPRSTMADAARSAPVRAGVKGAESTKPYSSLTIEIGESVEAS